ncbi:unnamed protein product [Calypogeia fissa]
MSREKVLIVALEQHSFFTSLYTGLLTALREKAELVLEVTTPAKAIEHLTTIPSTDVAAVLVADPAVILPKFAKVASKLVQYARDGGTLIFGGLCSSFGRPDDFGKFFERTLILPWKFGSYHRTTFVLNPAMVAANDRFAKPFVPKSCSMKAVHIAGAAPESRVYIATDGSVIESMVFSPTRITDRSESPVLFAEYGRGFVAWIGDVNAEAESTAVVVAICNL